MTNQTAADNRHSHRSTDDVGPEVHQQLDQLDQVLSDLREAIITTDNQSLLEHSGTLQSVVNQLERHYDSINDPTSKASTSLINRLQKLRGKLVGIGTLLELSRAKAADLLELMLGSAQPAETYAANGQMGLAGNGRGSVKA